MRSAESFGRFSVNEARGVPRMQRDGYCTRIVHRNIYKFYRNRGIDASILRQFLIMFASSWELIIQIFIFLITNLNHVLRRLHFYLVYRSTTKIHAQVFAYINQLWLITYLKLLQTRVCKRVKLCRCGTAFILSIRNLRSVNATIGRQFTCKCN